MEKNSIKANRPAGQARLELRRILLLLLLPVAICTLCLPGCTPDPEPTLRFRDREIIDSIFKVRVDSLKPILDSLCAMRHDSAVQYKVDSMILVREEEVKKYLERIRKSQEINK